jgi:hypothetical protein
MEKRGTVDQGKTGCITQKKIYDEKMHQFNYEETVQEDARIFNAANARYF